MKSLVCALLPLGLAACASDDLAQYRQEQPALHLERYLDGKLDAWGMFQDRFGRVKKRFHVTLQASWKGDAGVLDERFEWSDGTRSRRVWNLRRQPDGSYRGTAADVAGEAVGRLAGNALHWRYVLQLPVGDRTYNVDVDDWMFLMDDQVMLNRSTMSKWGVRVGEVTLAFVKR
ncbi:DUF3833 domain-containing protein [Massilia agilis]|uniref:DUF3833 domain-containing protein n=1 Tax=Massilia agilis TaxID=1811226 RepID=A0ABT2DDK3_9BURK|nr:DUF3833 domain-containing protein [Massilia agilis]MCS0809410.1 DUF3833 domain-containing protein [Massilia agilis]